MTTQLVTIRTGHKLAPGPAASYERMCVDFGATIPVTSAWRDPAEQAWMRRLYEAGQWPNFVARVEESDHPKGIAVDFGLPGRLWLSLYGAQHGWIRTDPKEWWHRVYFPARDQHAGRRPPAPPAPPAPPDPIDPEDTMRLISKPGGTTALLLPSGKWALIAEASSAAALIAAGVPVANVDLVTFERLTVPANRLHPL